MTSHTSGHRPFRPHWNRSTWASRDLSDHEPVPSSGKPDVAACIRSGRTESLAALFSSAPTLALDLSSAGLTGAHAQTLATWLGRCPVPMRLELHNNRLQNTGASAIATLLSANAPLTVLDLSCNRITAPGVNAIASSLRGNRQLGRLSLAGCHFDNPAAGELAGALAGNGTLKRLNLFNCKAPHEALKAIVDAIAVNTGLTSLNLGALGPAGAGIAWADMLAANTRLCRLNLYRNPIDDHGFAALAASLVTNTTLTTLKLKGEPLTRRRLEQLADALASNRSLCVLDFASTPDDSAAAKIKEILRRNTAESFQTRFALQWLLKSCGSGFDIPLDVTQEIITALSHHQDANPLEMKTSDAVLKYFQDGSGGRPAEAQ
jgi:hypothetical protein